MSEQLFSRLKEERSATRSLEEIKQSLLEGFVRTNGCGWYDDVTFDDVITLISLLEKQDGSNCKVKLEC